MDTDHKDYRVLYLRISEITRSYFNFVSVIATLISSIGNCNEAYRSDDSLVIRNSCRLLRKESDCNLIQPI